MLIKASDKLLELPGILARLIRADPWRELAYMSGRSRGSVCHVTVSETPAQSRPWTGTLDVKPRAKARHRLVGVHVRPDTPASQAYTFKSVFGSVYAESAALSPSVTHEHDKTSRWTRRRWMHAHQTADAYAWLHLLRFGPKVKCKSRSELLRMHSASSIAARLRAAVRSFHHLTRPGGQPVVPFHRSARPATTVTVAVMLVTVFHDLNKRSYGVVWVWHAKLYFARSLEIIN